mmetsp:Transcript_59340/g.171968  ORF Transcript_59340/g.171968 Transcript_59340/m.171968 type:complete len:95 (+) Transcript_59340:928-1212(+)
MLQRGAHLRPQGLQETAALAHGKGFPTCLQGGDALQRFPDLSGPQPMSPSNDAVSGERHQQFVGCAGRAFARQGVRQQPGGHGGGECLRHKRPP